MVVIKHLLRDPLLQLAVATVVVLLALQGQGRGLFDTELGSSSLPVIPLLFIATVVFELNRRGSGSARERRFWGLLAFSQVAWLLAELVYLLPIAEANEALVELANDGMLTVCYVGVILALQASPHRRDEPLGQDGAWQTLGTVLFACVLLLYFSLIPIYFNPDLYISLVPSMLFFVVLDLYLVVALAFLLRQTRSRRWTAVYGAIIAAEVLWTAADTGEGLIYLGVVASTPWASLTSTIALLTKIGAGRAARAPFRASAQSPSNDLDSRLRLAAWDGQLVLFALFLPVLHAVLGLAGLDDETTHRPREALTAASMVLFGTLAFANHRWLEKRNRQLEEKYRRTERQLAEEQLQAVGLRERERADEAIQHAQRLESLGVLAGGIAHDFNNLLTGIQVHADLALENLQPDSPAGQSIREVVAASERASVLTNQLLAYAGKGQYDVRRLDLNEVVKTITPLLQSSNHGTARLELVLAPAPLTVMADSVQLQQLVMNLVSNASEAIGHRPGTITVRTGAAGSGSVFLEVSDTGCGLDADTKAKIFDPFFSTKAAGRGLGLSAVEGMVRSHQGRISVESTPGAGSTFRVVLPASPGEMESVPAETGNAVRVTDSRGTLLVIDDQETVRRAARSILNADGWTVIDAVDGIAGLEAFRQHTEIAAVLLDLTMPGRSGDAVLDDLRQLRPNVPVILMSGYADADLLGLEGSEKIRFLRKPFRAEQLRTELQAALSP